MRRAVLFALLALSGGPLAAAPLPAGAVVEAPIPPSAVRLLLHEECRTQLALADDQLVGCMSLVELQFRAGTPRTEREAVQLAVMSQFVAKGLTPAQRTRLAQIDRRVRGPLAFADPPVRRALLLTDAQAEAIDRRLADYREADERLRSGAVDGAEDKIRADRVAARATGMKAITDLLTPAQRDAWKGLLGGPVKGFDADQFYLDRLGPAAESP